MPSRFSWSFLVMFEILFLSKQSRAQSAMVSGLYEFLVECPLMRCDISGNISDTTVLIAPSRSHFVLTDLKKDTCVIRFALPKGNHRSNKNEPVYSADFTSYHYFCITRAQLDFKCRPMAQSEFDFLVGNIVTPVKLRVNPFDFTKDITIGTTFGLKYRMNEKRPASLDLLLGLGVSSVTLDSASTQGTVHNGVDTWVFTTSLGLVVEFGQAQVGLFSGFDFMTSKEAKKYSWIYKRQPWISFGLGFAIFSFNLKK
ncbi:MAG: hypothetical protein U0T73_10765 [Chitinophagales bacterium]